MARRIKFQVLPWTEVQEQNADLKVGCVYVKAIFHRDKPSILQYKLRIADEIITGQMNEYNSNIPLRRLPNNKNVNKFIASNYRKNILAFTNKKGHTLGKNNRGWLFDLLIAGFSGIGAALLTFYATAQFSIVASEFLISLGAATLSMVAGSVVGIGLTLGMIAVGSWLLFKTKDRNNDTQILEGSLVSAIGWAGLGASTGALLGTFLFPGLGSALGAAIGGGIGLGISLLLISTAVIINCFPDKWDKMIIENNYNPDEFGLDPEISKDEKMDFILEKNAYLYSNPAHNRRKKTAEIFPKPQELLSEETEIFSDSKKGL